MVEQVFAQMGRFRQKVIRLVIFERKSIYEAAIACGCTPEKIKRVIKKWKLLTKYQPVITEKER